MSEIYKVNRVINNQISQIYVFIGNESKTVEEIKIDRNIFSAKEIQYIDENNTPVHVINEYIHGDDTIKRIKEKIHCPIELIDHYGINGDFIESQAFGYLSIRSFFKKEISFPSTTNVRMPISGGEIIKLT